MQYLLWIFPLQLVSLKKIEKLFHITKSFGRANEQSTAWRQAHELNILIEK